LSGAPRPVPFRACDIIVEMSLGQEVFVSHGRDKVARREFFTFLRAIGLKPVEWSVALSESAGGSPLISDTLDKAFGPDRAFIVLLTPDDIVQLKEEHADDEDDPETRPSGQARPNVLFEAGMAFARYPDHTVLVEFGKVRRFTNIDARFRVRLDNSPESRSRLAHRLEAIGCDVDLRAEDWYSAGDLTPPATKPAPRQTRARASVAHPETPGELQFTSNPGKWRLDFGSIGVNPKKRSSITVHGEVTSRENAVLTLVLKATFYADSDIVGSAVGFVNDLTFAECRAFEISTRDDLADFSRVHVHIDTGVKA
jgi:hypothetical protein